MEKYSNLPDYEFEEFFNSKNYIPNDLKELVKQAFESYKVNNLIVAHEKLYEAIELSPENLPLIIAHGKILQLLGSPEDASLEFVKVMLLNRDYAFENLNSEALNLIAENYLQIDEPKKAKLIYKRVLEIDPSNELAKQKLYSISKTN